MQLELPKSTIVTAESVRAAFERCLEVLQYHLTSSKRIWTAYRSFEANMVVKVLENPSDEQVDALQKKLGTLFRRQLGQPAFGLEEVMQQYIQIQGGDADAAPVPQYEKAKALLEERKEFEASVLPSESDDAEEAQMSGIGQIKPPDYSKLSHWWEYIKFEESKKSPVGRVKCVYERALKSFYLVPDLWKSYATYMVRVSIRVLPCSIRIVMFIRIAAQMTLF
jgi:hypothetical protein